MTALRKFNVAYLPVFCPAEYVALSRLNISDEIPFPTRLDGDCRSVTHVIANLRSGIAFSVSVASLSD